MLLKRLAQSFRELLNRSFVPLVPSPVSFFLRVHEAGFLEDGHMVGDGRLREMNALLDIARAEANLLTERAGIPGFQSLQNFPAGGIGNRVQMTAEGLLVGGHTVGIKR